MVRDGIDPRAMVKDRGLEKMDDIESIKPLVDKVLAANPVKVQEYQGGKTGLMGFFMGQVMARSQGKADPRLANRLIRQELDRS